MDRSRYLIATLAALALFAAPAVAKPHHKPQRPRCPAGYSARRMLIHERRHWRRVWVPVLGCAKAEPVRIVTVTVPGPATTVTTQAPQPAAVRPALSLTYTQDPSNPLDVTWTFAAANPEGELPPGLLDLVVQRDPNGAEVHRWTINVGGGDASGGTETLTLPSHGIYDVTVTYDGSSYVVPSTQTWKETF